MLDYCIVDTHTIHIWNFVDEQNAAQEIERANASNEADITRMAPYVAEYNPTLTPIYESCIARRGKFVGMTFDEFQRMERERLLSMPLCESDAETFDDMLNVLPPLYRVTINDVEMFSTPEMYTGTYNTQYAHDRTTGKYYSKMVDVRDKSTWIHHILRSERPATI